MLEQGYDAQKVLQEATIKIRAKYDLYEMTLQVEEFQQDMDGCGQCQDPSGYKPTREGFCCCSDLVFSTIKFMIKENIYFFVNQCNRTNLFSHAIIFPSLNKHLSFSFC